MGALFSGLGGLLAVLAFIISCGVSVAKKDEWGAFKVVSFNVVMLVIVGVLFWFTGPVWANELIFQGMWLHIFHFIPVVIGIAIVYGSLHLYSNRRGALGTVYALLACIFIIGGPVLVETGRNWKICETYRFGKIDSMVQINPNAVRFTPIQVAHNDMVRTLTSSQFTVDYDLTDVIDVNGGFGYVTPISPEGAIVTFTEKNDGFVVYNDSPEISDDARVKRVKQTFEIGEGMEWTDDILRNLYQEDMTCEYPEIYYLQLNPENPDEFTAVAPKINYSYEFPCFFIPYWDGVTLIHANGKIEGLNQEEALKDQRLRGKRIFPQELARKLVEVQIYDQGYMSGWYNREGKIEIPTLPGKNQMPYYTDAADGKSYFIIATEPTGEAYALFRMYHVDTYTGDLTYHEFDATKGILGPVSAIDYAMKLQGYKWVEETGQGEQGNFRVIESVYLTKGSRLYWKYTITTKSYTGVVSTVVVDATSKEVQEFKTRSLFQAWLLDESSEFEATIEKSTQEPGSARARINLLKAKVLEIMSELEKLAAELAPPENQE